MLWFTSAALAGYGDPVDGLPTYADRETFFWTNVVRADPEALRDEYPCNFNGFQSSEKTPKPLLRMDSGLNAAASYHSNDMRDDHYFSHDSNDGTSWDARIRRFYNEGSALGENIAQGYADPYSAVVEGWMCSSGHRSNIMSSTYNELGTGVAGNYYTQDFARGNVPTRGMGIGLHQPEQPQGQAALAVDFDAEVVPDEIYVVVAGERFDLDLVQGTEQRGIYRTTVPGGSGCRPYYFVAKAGAYTETWPQDGSYGWGNCAWDDPSARWLDEQAPLPTPPGDTGDTGLSSTVDDTGLVGTDTVDTDPAATTPDGDVPATGAPAGCGCASTGSAGAWWWPGWLLLGLRRRRA
ncbi:MAG: CAP domain-containing protein [Alphaproteobacteria bacterium]|nr:CAP domain-containing protein [Alphaproteobacteria bacterium]MCB9698041.1 CAP domain-containing protein [Alphaproteobacteria bacterium]